MNAGRIAGAGLVAALGLSLLAGCGSDDAASDPTPADTTPVPGEAYQATTWNPPAPDQPVDPATVEEQYGPAVDALVAASDKAKSFGKAEVVTEEHVSHDATVCAVGVRRTGDGIVPSDFYLFQQDLAAAAKKVDFPDLVADSDPGGAVVFVAHDSSNALLEWRSKGQTTITVYVPTTASEC